MRKFSLRELHILAVETIPSLYDINGVPQYNVVFDWLEKLENIKDVEMDKILRFEEKEEQPILTDE